MHTMHALLRIAFAWKILIVVDYVFIQRAVACRDANFSYHKIYEYRQKHCRIKLFHFERARKQSQVSSLGTHLT